MLKISRYLPVIIWLGFMEVAAAHPVSMMTGKAVWAGGQLIINMEMTLENMMLHYHLPEDEEGRLSGPAVAEKEREFMDFVQKNFLTMAPDTLFPQVTLMQKAEPLPEKVKRWQLRDNLVQFEIRFDCGTEVQKIKLVQTMSEGAKGLQSTALVTFHLGSEPQFVPLYSSIPVTIDLDHGTATTERISPVMTITDSTFTVNLLTEWTAHGVPFELLGGGRNLAMTSMKKGHYYTICAYERPLDVDTFVIKWVDFSWQMRRVDMIVRHGDHEKKVIISRFHPEGVIDLRAKPSEGTDQQP